ALAEERKKFLDSGLDDCILKPIRLQTLYDALGLKFEADTHLPEADAKPTPALIDESILKELSQVLLPERTAQTIRRVCEEIEAEVPAIAKQSDNAEQIGKRAHKLAGSAAIVGAEALAQLLRTIETAEKAGEYKKIHAALVELPDVASLTTTALIQRMPLVP
ncbi:MAG: Hpt domain-containing protein, partial [Alphaproteobacteria bacterium]|nr:Hpt domain-containing protein [Alphaproteobacteria bacterium]